MRSLQCCINGGTGMFIVMSKASANEMLAGYFQKEPLNNKNMCILDTKDLVLESYSLDDYKRICEKLKVHNLGINSFKSEAPKSLFNGKVKVEYGRNSAWMMFCEKPVLAFNYGAGDVDSLILKGYSNMNGDSIPLFTLTSRQADKADFYLMCGQKISNNLYRVVLQVKLMCSDPSFVCGQFFVCCIFSSKEYFGVEYVYNITEGFVDFNKACYPSGDLGAKLLFLRAEA